MDNLSEDPRDPRVQAKKYLEKHKIPQLLEAMSAQLLYHKPEDHRKYLIDYLEGVKIHGTPSLLLPDDFAAMFEMFDITKRGLISLEQANKALKIILGKDADLRNVNPDIQSMLTKDAFVRNMNISVNEATPYKPLSQQ
uniref:EF-hand domain-containing protein n=1 Tax=Polytomella parva TaxID=51329 RepID=A0A7S0YGA8_9CHLO|mmetsp:Transcript_25374/g.46096  ORF Transcript_25374/g.46096 Transcript_25374/m.46096 type:complete len:139 (+) Transcript_25374:78-494(+)